MPHYKSSNSSISGSAGSGNMSASSFGGNELLIVDNVVEVRGMEYEHDVNFTVAQSGRYLVPAALVNYTTSQELTNANLSTGVKVEVKSVSNPLSFKTDNGVDSRVIVTVPFEADGGVVLDLSQVTYYADGIYQMQTQTDGLTLAVFPGITPVGEKFDPNTQVFPKSLATERQLHLPYVQVVNKSNYPVYLHTDSGLFDDVSKQVGVRSLETSEFQYNPITKVWTLV